MRKVLNSGDQDWCSTSQNLVTEFYHSTDVHNIFFKQLTNQHQVKLHHAIYSDWKKIVFDMCHQQYYFGSFSLIY